MKDNSSCSMQNVATFSVCKNLKFYWRFVTMKLYRYIGSPFTFWVTIYPCVMYNVTKYCAFQLFPRLSNLGVNRQSPYYLPKIHYYIIVSNENVFYVMAVLVYESYGHNSLKRRFYSIWKLCSRKFLIFVVV